MKRTLFIGDIHGCFRELQELLRLIDWKPREDRLISLGDLIHKGPDSAAVVAFMIRNKIEVILGNHEYHLLKSLRGERPMYEEAEEIVQASGLTAELMTLWLESLPLIIEDSRFIAIHGALNPALDNYRDSTPDEIIFGRYFDSKRGKIHGKLKRDGLIPWYEAYPEGSPDRRTVIYGHWAKTDNVIYKNSRGLDTGCCYGGHLSAYILEEDRIVRVRSSQPRQFDY